MTQSRMPCLLFALLIACKGDVGTGPPREPEIPCTRASGHCASSLEISEHLKLRYFRTHPLDVGNRGISHSVIVVHGTNRDADNYFNTMVAATRAAGMLDSTVVIAPNFLIADDVPAVDEAYWTNGGWKRGSNSLNGIEQISSYSAMDRLLETLTTGVHFPDLTAIVVTGHSAGGQYVHRYAAGNRLEMQLVAVAIRYVVANPSSYLYLGPQRAVPHSIDVFHTPDREGCPTYNSWHYGLEDLNEYMSAVRPGEIRDQLTSRDVVYLLGDADSLSGNLDVSCEANLQGSYRYTRGLTLFNFMDAYFPEHRHSLVVVPGVGHSSSAMYSSAQGKRALFDP